jgi:hypothetical protein
MFGREAVARQRRRIVGDGDRLERRPARRPRSTSSSPGRALPVASGIRLKNSSCAKRDRGLRRAPRARSRPDRTSRPRAGARNGLGASTQLAAEPVRLPSRSNRVVLRDRRCRPGAALRSSARPSDRATTRRAALTNAQSAHPVARIDGPRRIEVSPA